MAAPPSNKRLFPDPNLPQTRESSPVGKVRFRLARVNFWGVLMGVESEAFRGHVTEHESKVMT
jgi:hypothetical protein